MEKNLKKFFILILITSVLAASTFGALAGFLAFKYFSDQNNSFERIFTDKKVLKVEEESAVISAVEKVSPAVVSIIVTKDLPVLERYYQSPGNDFFRDFFGGGLDDFFGIPQYRQKGTERQEVGGGTGFLISDDGYIITNRHVVIDEDAEYTVLMNDESRHEAKVLARDNLADLAVLKIEGKDLPYAELGDSSELKVGQSVIAIGNALGEFRNTVSTGVISGLSRSIVAGGRGVLEQLSGVIQTDASINPGNSGGPLLNLAGQVIGINTAMAQGAQNIGFAIPVNDVKSTIESVKEHGRIIRPWLGVRYMLINKEIQKANNLDVDYGVLIMRGENRTDLAVIPGSPADKAGLVENDIILEINGQKINQENTLAKLISQQKPGDEVLLKILHKGEEKEVKVKLGEMDY